MQVIFTNTDFSLQCFIYIGTLNSDLTVRSCCFGTLWPIGYLKPLGNTVWASNFTDIFSGTILAHFSYRYCLWYESYRRIKMYTSLCRLVPFLCEICAQHTDIVYSSKSFCDRSVAITCGMYVVGMSAYVTVESSWGFILLLL